MLEMLFSIIGGVIVIGFGLGMALLLPEVLILISGAVLIDGSAEGINIVFHIVMVIASLFGLYARYGN